MRELKQVTEGRNALGVQRTDLQNNTAFQLELLRTLDDASERISRELSDQWDQLKGIAEAGRNIEARLEALDSTLLALTKIIRELPPS